MKIKRQRTTTGYILQPEEGAHISAKHMGFSGQLMRVERRANTVLRRQGLPNDFPKRGDANLFRRREAMSGAILNPAGCYFEYPIAIAKLLKDPSTSAAKEAANFKLQLENFRELIKRYSEPDEHKDAETLVQLGFDLGNRAASMRLEALSGLIERGTKSKRAIAAAASAKRKQGEETRRAVQEAEKAGKLSTVPTSKRNASRYRQEKRPYRRSG